ncbi:hypothetical protein IWQ51_004444 [Labrenzia sp. EL_142]|nr:hypothetical protein [Labrenzia sp. EL_142]
MHDGSYIFQSGLDKRACLAGSENCLRAPPLSKKNTDRYYACDARHFEAPVFLPKYNAAAAEKGTNRCLAVDVDHNPEEDLT